MIALLSERVDTKRDCDHGKQSSSLKNLELLGSNRDVEARHVAYITRNDDISLI